MHPSRLHCYNPPVDEKAYIDRRRPDWERLAAILARASSRAGLKSLSGSELLDLGKLYRRITSDLSYLKASSSDEDLVLYLNELAGRAHGYLYANAPPGGIRSILNFLLRGFPVLFRAKWRFIAAAAAMLLLSGAFAAVKVKTSPAAYVHFVPQQFAEIKIPKGDEPVGQGAGELIAPATLSSGIMANNIFVSFRAFAGGVTFGALTAWELIKNGLMLGALAVILSPSAAWALRFWSLILPHGIIELTAICIAGGAGFILGWALIAPGNLSRWDSLRKASREALPLIGGVVAMLIVAGLIEGFITPSSLPPALKLVFAGLTAVGLVLYFDRPGREHSTLTRSAVDSREAGRSLRSPHS